MKGSRAEVGSCESLNARKELFLKDVMIANYENT